MRCNPCRVTYQGTRYAIAADGTVRPALIIMEPVIDDEALPTGDLIRTRVVGAPVDADLAKQVRHEASRQRRNRNSRERYQAMTDIGMVKTPYGRE